MNNHPGSPFLFRLPSEFAVGDGTVAIITRAKRRPLLLERTMRSILAQTYENWVHVILLDDATPEVQAVASSMDAAYKGRLNRIQVSSGGQVDGLINHGIEATRSEFIAILDDDDVWRESYLSTMVDYLRGPEGKRKGGVACWTEIVQESVEGDKISVINRFEHQPQLSSISFSRSFEANRCFTNTFLYRRSAVEKIGGYNRELAFIGDWEFSLRFQLHFEIGVVQQVLAEYHQRPRGSTHFDGNTILQSQKVHEISDFTLRDQQIRLALAKNPELLSVFLLMGRYNLELTDRLIRIEETVQRIGKLISPLVLVYRFARWMISPIKPIRKKEPRLG